MAEAIAAKYGLPVEAIAKRMAVGRFRVKANIDLPTATRFAAALEVLGAVCTVVDASTGKAQAARGSAPAAPPTPAARAEKPGPPQHVTVAAPGAPPPPRAAKPTADSPQPADAHAPASKQEYASGLAAAFSGAEASSQTDLGAIMDDTGQFSLATLDGAEEEKPARVEKIESVPAPPVDDNAFLPPEEVEKGEHGLELAVDVASQPRRTPPSVPAQADADSDLEGAQSMLAQMADVQGRVDATPLPGPRPATAPTEAPLAPAPAAASGNPLQRARDELASRPHLRLAVGVFLAVLLGFVPAHFVAALRESSAYDKYREEILEIQAAYLEAKTRDDLQDLELQVASVREEKKRQMESKRTNIAITGFLVWVAAGGGLGFLWFRKLDWDG